MSDQVQDLKKALNLEVFIRDKKDELNRLEREQFKQKPVPPQHQTIQPAYPEKPKPDYGYYLRHYNTKATRVLKIYHVKNVSSAILVWFVIQIVLSVINFIANRIPIETVSHIVNGIAYLVDLALIIPLLIFFFSSRFDYRKKKEDVRSAMAAEQPEYVAACKAADEQAARAQQEEDARYAAAKKKYEEETMPQYAQALDAWTKRKNAELIKGQQELDEAVQQLMVHYEQTKILPLSYRRIDAMKHIYDTVSTSNCTIQQAIDLYDRQEQYKLEQQRLYQQEEANELQREANAQAAEQARLIEEQNDIADRARKEANIAAVVGAVQRHSINKKLKEVSNPKK